MPILKDLKLEYYLPKGIIDNYNVIINGITLLTKRLIQIQNDMKKLENYQQDKVKIALMDVF